MLAGVLRAPLVILWCALVLLWGSSAAILRAFHGVIARLMVSFVSPMGLHLLSFPENQEKVFESRKFFEKFPENFSNLENFPEKFPEIFFSMPTCHKPWVFDISQNFPKTFRKIGKLFGKFWEMSKTQGLWHCGIKKSFRENFRETFRDSKSFREILGNVKNPRFVTFGHQKKFSRNFSNLEKISRKL